MMYLCNHAVIFRRYNRSGRVIRHLVGLREYYNATYCFQFLTCILAIISIPQKSAQKPKPKPKPNSVEYQNVRTRDFLRKWRGAWLGVEYG